LQSRLCGGELIGFIGLKAMQLQSHLCGGELSIFRYKSLNPLNIKERKESTPKNTNFVLHVAATDKGETTTTEPRKTKLPCVSRMFNVN
ncbi:hypothetical protein, partial [Roseibium sp. RKSG952]|uniref:hypothetical protein n=1 Tax=Roseibium sp. RKSG952 TaxID=2529384 RepID=UPI0018AD14E0